MTTKIQPWSSESIVGILLARVAAEPDTAVYRFASEPGPYKELTYRELHAGARQVAASLRDLHPAPTTAVLLHPSGPDFIVAFFGCLYAGVVAVPAAPTRVAGDIRTLEAIAVDSGASVVVTTPSLLRRMQRAVGGGGRGIHFIVQPNALTATHTDLPIVAAHLDHPAYLQYTSGSTGSPRGVMVTHRNVISNLEFIQRDFRHDRSSVSVTWLPHFHDMGLVYGLLQPIYSGFVSIVLPPSILGTSPVKWLEAISRNRATHSGGPNFAYDLCVRKVAVSARAALDLSSWRVAFNGAERVLAETLEQFTRAFSPCGFSSSAFYPAYGLAEATLKVSGAFFSPSCVCRFDANALRQNRIILTKQDDSTRWVSCGMPRADAPVKIIVVDSDRSVQSAPGVVGEIWVSGDSVAKGYWNRPKDTERIFRAFLRDTGEGPFLRTGDLGAILEGELFITGRLKELMIIRGENHYPQDVEQTITEAIACELCVAFTVTVDGEERAIAVCELKPKKLVPDFDSIVACIRCAVTQRHGFTLRTVCFVRAGTLPRTSSGKLQRSKTRDTYFSGEMSIIHQDTLTEQTEISSPVQRVEQQDESEILRRLRQMLSQVLNCAVSYSDTSLALTSTGVDSLKAQEFRALIEKEFGRSVSFEQLLGGGSLRTIASEIAPAIVGVSEENKVCIGGGEDAAWLPCSPGQERLWYAAALASENCPYNLAFGLRLNGNLNLEAWDAALAEIEWRHESLRTNFAAIQGVPRCRIGAARRKVVRVADIRNFPEARREEEARRMAEAESRAPFNLELDPMLRVLIIHLRENERIAVFVVHHIASDVHSFQIILRELSDYYEMLVQGRPIARSHVYRYSQYISDARARLSTVASTRDEIFWASKLKHEVDPLVLPYDNPRPARRTYNADEVQFSVDHALFNRLNDLARLESVTPFVIYASAFYTVLYIISQQRTLMIGCPVANRTSADLQEVVGLFSHPVPVLVTLNGGENLRDLLQSVRAAIVESLEHQELPFSRILEMAPSGNASSLSSVISVMFGFHGTVDEGFKLSDIESTAYHIPWPGTDFSLFLDVEASPQGVRGSMVYDAQIFRRTTIEKVAEDYLAVLSKLALDTSAPITAVLAQETRAKAISPTRLETIPANIVISSTFIADPVRDVIGWWCSELGVSVTTHITPSERLPDQLIDSTSAFRTNAFGLNVILIRLQDFPDDPDYLNNIISLIQSAVHRNPIPHLVYVCPSSIESQALVSKQRDFSDKIRGIPQVELISSTQLMERYSIANWLDVTSDRLASIPYVQEYWAGLATDIVRKTMAYMRAPIKALIVDCDETLWGGICAEDGISNLSISPGHRALQEHLLEQRRRGVLLCLCSKNNPEDVQEVFDRLQGMVLAHSDFEIIKVNWLPKSQNVQEIARELNFSLDSLVFVDNDIRECTEVAAHHPEINVVCLPAHASQYGDFLDHNWIFDQTFNTREGNDRALFYRQNVPREGHRQHATDLKSYVDSLDIRIEFREMDVSTSIRASELTYRTTQFNTSGVHWTAGQIVSAINRGEILGITCNVEDRFGSYGLVGVILLSPGAHAFSVELLALSCRALGRGVEERMIAHVLKIAEQHGYKWVEVPVRSTNRNKPAINFFERVSNETLDVDNRSERRYRIAVSNHIEFNPSFTREESNEKYVNSATLAGIEKSERLSIPSEQLNWVASRLRTAAAILQSFREATRISGLASNSFIPPANPTEEAVASVWAEVLNVGRVGRLDDFFELGGHSLKAMQILARLNERFDVDLPLDLLFDSSPTIADLAKAIDEQSPGRWPSTHQASSV